MFNQSGEPPLILLIDSEAIRLQKLHTMLAREGYRIEEITDTAISLTASAHLDPALIILGMMDSQEESLRLCKQHTDMLHTPPVLLLLSDEDETTVERALQFGAADYLTPTTPLAAVCHRVRRLIGGDSQFREMVEISPGMIWTAASDGYCTYVNHAWLELTGRTVQEELGFGWAGLVHPDDLDNYVAAYQVALAAKKSLNIAYRIRRHDGEYRWLLDSSRPTYAPDGHFIGVVGSCIDITDQKRAEEALQKANQSFHALIQAAPLAITVLDLEGNVKLWNPAAERIFGWRSQDIVGTIYPFMPTDARTAGRFAAALKGEILDNIEFQCNRIDGTLIEVSASAAPLYDGDSIEGSMVVLEDITARKRAEAAERSQRVFAEAMRDITAALTSTLDLEAVMNLILEMVGRVVPHDAANIMQIEGDFVRVTQQRGYPTALADMIQAERYRFLSMPNFQRMFTTFESCLIEDVHKQTNWVSAYDYDWIRAYIGTPIRVYGHVVGFLNLDSKTPGAFTQTDVEHLEAFANQVAIAIENAQLYDAIRRDAAELKLLHRVTSFLFTTNLFTHNSLADVAAQIAQAIVHEFGPLTCSVLKMDEKAWQLLLLARVGDGDGSEYATLSLDEAGMIQHSVRSGQIVFMPQLLPEHRTRGVAANTQSQLVLPLQTSKGPIGALDLQSPLPEAFSAQDERVLRAFAEQASAAIENMLLYEEIRLYTQALEERVSERTAESNRAKERVEAILNNSSDAIIMVRADGIIQQTNHAFNTTFGYGMDEAFGRPVAILARGDHADEMVKALRHVVEENRAQRVELVVRTVDDSAFDADVMLSPITERDGQILSVVCSLRDITDRKRTELELRNALAREKELNDLKSRFISTVSHEFRTPLAMIMTSSDILKSYSHRLTETDKAARLDKIQIEVKNITYMLDDLLQISRSDQIEQIEFHPTRMDLPQICREILREIETGVGVQHRFIFDCMGDYPMAVMDLKLLKRILFNLLSNAVKYSLPEHAISFTLICEQTQKVFLIADEGIGVPEEDQQRLFEAFHRGKNVGHISGTGLGLAIVKHAVGLHGGSIAVKSHVNEGTTFIVTIPEIELREEHDGKDA
jgi:PAS domain S-box-containing protein